MSNDKSNNQQLSLTAQPRELRKKAVQALRKSGIIPAVVYGNNFETQMIQVPALAFEKVYAQAGESTLITLSIEGGQSMPVLIHDLDRDHVNNNISHVDFFVVNMKEEVHTEVPLHYVGVAPAVKEDGGVLVKNFDHISIKCLPQDLISELEVDISSLKTFEDAIHVSDLQIPSGIEVQHEADEVVATVTPPRTTEELESLNEAVSGDVSNVEGVTKPTDTPAEGGDDKKDNKKEDKK